MFLFDVKLELSCSLTILAAALGWGLSKIERKIVTTKMKKSLESISSRLLLVIKGGTYMLEYKQNLKISVKAK